MENKDGKKYVAIWMSYEGYFELLSPAEVGRLVLAMMKYESSGAAPELRGNERYIWPAIKRDMDASAAKQGGRSETNRRNALKRWEHEKDGALDEGLEPNANECERMQADANDAIEKEKEKGNGNRNGKGKTGASGAEPENGSPPMISLPLNDGTAYPISVEQCRKWAELYPAVDVPQELRKMLGWLDANPSKRKTRRGILRFAAGWLAREQDKGPRRNDGANSWQASGGGGAQASAMDDLRELHALFDEEGSE